MLSTYVRQFKMINGFSCLTFNTLAEGYFTQQSFPKVQLLSFKQRMNTFKKMLKRYNASIICLQQIDEVDQFADYLQKLGYLTFFNAVQHKTRKGTTQGILVCIKMHDFNVKSYDHKYYMEKFSHQFWFFQLESVKNKNKLFFYGTHLKSKVQNQQIRIKQSQQLFAHIKNTNQQNPNVPILVLGDFNSEPTYQSLKIFKDTQLFNSQKLLSAYEFDDWTTNKVRETHEIRTIDYIFYKGLNIIGYEGIPELKDVSKTGLPDKLNPSDHIPLYAIFTFK